MLCRKRFRRLDRVGKSRCNVSRQYKKALPLKGIPALRKTDKALPLKGFAVLRKTDKAMRGLSGAFKAKSVAA